MSSRGHCESLRASLQSTYPTVGCFCVLLPFHSFPSSLSPFSTSSPNLSRLVAGSGPGPTAANFLELYKVPLMESVHATCPEVFHFLWQLCNRSWCLEMRLAFSVLQVFKFPIRGSAGSLLVYVAALGSRRLGRGSEPPKGPQS